MDINMATISHIHHTSDFELLSIDNNLHLSPLICHGLLLYPNSTIFVGSHCHMHFDVGVLHVMALHK